MLLKIDSLNVENFSIDLIITMQLMILEANIWLESRVGKLVFSPSIVAFFDTGVKPEVFDTNNVRVFQSGRGFVVNSLY
ncbi:hypothetical protein BpHYR1_010250 [Brachionus plicatilis]|uniref:Uncharacterized protein n=1 Tax=Brachionus plicatilis TaxID=10195 RepID=A0A3M7RCB6_BRAPC|nr:hypothetical protein BpHYR1_010250 [Brachionus plicatilis]